MPGLDALTYNNGIRSFQTGGTTSDPITGLYRDIFDRAPDAGGLEYWTNAYNQGTPLSEIEQAFRNSPEYLNRPAANTQQGTVTVTGLPANQATNLGTLNTTVAQPAPVTQGLEAWYEQNLGRKIDPSGSQYWSGQFGETLDPNEIAQLQASDEYKNRQFLTDLYKTELGRTTPDEPGLQWWTQQMGRGATQADVISGFNKSPEGQVFDLYKNVLGRDPDEEGKKTWLNALESGASLDDVSRQIALSPEAKGLRATELSGLFTKDFGTDFVNSLTADEMNRFTDLYSDITAKQKYTSPVKATEFDRDFYLQNNPDVARAGVDPYQHYLEYGFNEGRAPNATGPGAMTAEQRYQEVMKQAALDPELGAIIKAKDPFLYESLTPLTNNPNQQKTTERIRFGQYGTYNIDGVDVPILNAKVADQILGRDQFGEVSDFSHGRGRALAELGWTGNSFSNKIARGAQALGVTAGGYGDQIYYQGLEDAAKIVGIDPNKFQDKQVPAISQPYVDESGIYREGGQPLFLTDEYGNVMRDPQTGEPIPQMTTVSRDQQLYDAINEAAKDIYLYTGDSLTPGRASEGGRQSFDTVLYKRVGDELIPLTAPTSHGGMQNLDVYTGGSGFNFGRDIAPGLIFVGGAALAWTGAGALAASLGNSLAGAVGLTVSKGTASIIGGIAIGAATGALTAAATGSDIGQGALKGGVAGGVGASMPQILGNIPGMGSTVNSIASSLNLNPADVGNVISSTLSRTLSTASAGANGDQILNAFGTALASTTLGAAGANAVKSVFADSFTPSQLAGMARATQLVTNAAASSVISGGSAEQVANSVINSLVSGAGSIQKAAASAKPPEVLTKAELDAWMQGQGQVQTGPSPYYETAGGDVLVRRGEVSVTQAPQDFQGAALETPQLPPEEEAEYAKQVAAQDAKVQASLANKAAEVTFKLETANAADEYILDALKLYDIPLKTAKIALDMSKAGASQTQIANALSQGKVTSKAEGTGTTGTETKGGTSTGGTGEAGEGGGTGEGAGGGGGEGTDGGGGEGTGIGGTGTGTGGTGTGGTGTGSGNLPALPRLPTIPQITAARRVATDDMDGIYNLTPGLTKARTDYQLAGQFKMADGGSVSQYNPFGLRDTSMDSGIYDAAKSPFIGSDIKMPRLTVGLTKRMLDYALPGLFKMAEGGSVPGGHNPQFFSEGGLNTLENTYVNGEGDGTSDSVPAMLATGEFVIPADVVSSLGNGSNEAGANVLDEFLQVIREHKQKHDAKKLPPDSKGALAYLLDAKKRA